MHQTSLLKVFSGILLSTLVVPSLAMATGGQASIKIEQLSPQNPGKWTMISSTGTVRSSTDNGVNMNTFSFGVSDYGPTTLSIDPPAGMTARITVYRGGEKVGESDAHQYSFSIVANDNYRFVVQYSLSKLGSLGVTSDPAGVKFRMKGASGRSFSATTPFTFQNIPIGRYSLEFPAQNGCTEPTKQSAVIEEGQRNTIHVSMASCKEVRQDKKDYTRVSKRTIREQAQQRELKPRGQRK